MLEACGLLRSIHSRGGTQGLASLEKMPAAVGSCRTTANRFRLFHDRGRRLPVGR